MARKVPVPGLLSAVFAYFVGNCVDRTYAGVQKLGQLTPWNFDEHVGGETAVLAMFHAPWCGGCKKYMPKFEEVALMLRDVDALSVMKADVTEFEYEELQENLNVSRVPAIKLFGKHSATPLTMLPQDPFDMHFAVKEKLGL